MILSGLAALATITGVPFPLPVPAQRPEARGAGPTAVPESGREEIYKSVDNAELKLWIFEPEGHAPNAARPAIVFFFGGGWRGGTPCQFEPHCRYLASRGMVAITADYRVRSRHGTLADACVSDAKSAVRWIRLHADRLGVDPQRIVAAGGSAGGHIAACSGIVPGLNEPTEDTSVSSVPDALALFNPALVLDRYDGVDLDPATLADLAERTGVEPRRISPIHHIREGLPPTIIFHGKADTTVTYQSVKAYRDAAVAAGNRCKLEGYEDAGHGFFNHGRGGKPGEFYIRTVFALDRFLASLGDLSGEPTVAASVSENTHLRTHLDHAKQVFETDRRGTVAFLGGSITEMEGYRPRVEAFLRSTFPDTEFRFINAGISSTCSTTGAFRLGRDVLDHDPDLLFVEFAVNDDQDAGHAPRECVRGMEGIIRQARKSNPAMDIVMIHFVNPGILETTRGDETPVTIAAHEKVARRYGVSSVNVAAEVADRITAGTLSWDAYGGTHPGDRGNRLAARLITDLLAASWNRQSSRVSPDGKPRLPRPLDAGSYDSARLVDVAEATLGQRWDVRIPDWSSLSGNVRQQFRNRRMLCGTGPTGETTLTFSGTTVGGYLLAGPDAGEIRVSIDGGPSRTVETYHRFSESLHYPRTVIFASDLDPGTHRLTFSIPEQPGRGPDPPAVRILAFAVN